ncbi:MAG: HAMP domain-containing protein [Verrucomicrobiae bacterium]|nr:HAMP domain-containing protein [Verrucomicrobiae bacterium]
MNSLRFRLALLSTLISGVVIVSFGVFAWKLTERSLLESVDLRLSIPLDRILRDLHPFENNARVKTYTEIAYREEIDSGNLMVWIKDDRLDEVLFSGPDAKWVTGVDPELIKPKIPPVPQEGELGAREILDGLREEFGGPPPEGMGRPPLPKGPPPPRQDPRGAGPPRPDAELPVEFSNAQLSGKNWRLGVAQDRGFTVLIGQELSSVTTELSRIRRWFLVALPVGLLLIGGGGWLVAKRAMRPVRIITETARKISAAGLDERIPPAARDSPELAKLVDVLNAMMDRLERSFHHAVRFSADVSHELKTPLAVMQGEIEAALRECAPGSREEQGLLSLGQETQRLKAITKSLMLLSQADSGRLPIKRETFSLSDELEAVCEDAEILCGEAGLDLICDTKSGVTIHSDPILLRQAIQNLVSNAVKYNRPEGWVSVILRRFSDAGPSVITVSNSGPGIPEADRDKIFDRFYRVDKARTRSIDGFGLGLNLTQEIVRALGGTLSLSGASEDETRFEITLPDHPS